MKDLLIAARRLQDFLDARDWKSCIIGGIAVQRWGEPRFTRDVDVTLLTGLGGVEVFVDDVLRHFRSRVANGREFALLRRVLLLVADDGTEIDMALGGLPFEAEAVARASDFEFYPGLTLRTCSAEDLLVMKAFAARDQDWLDVRGIIARQGDRLDWDLVWKKLRPLAELKEEPEILNRLRKMRRSIKP